MDLLSPILSALIVALPKAGPIIAVVVKGVLAAVVVATALVALLHSVVAVLRAVASAGVPKASVIADALSKDAAAADGLMSKVQALVGQLSVLPLPKK